jgi:hypothetical protein
MKDFERTLKAFQTEMECSVSSRALYETYVYETYVMPYINEVARKHNLEIEHAKKAEYHRGYVDGTNQRKTETWQLDHDRAEVLARLVNSNLESGSAMRSLCFVLGVDWSSDNTTRSLGEMKARLAYLLGGAVEDSKLQKATNLEDGEDREDSNMTNSTDCGELEATIAELREKVKNQRKYLAENATQHNYALELKLHKAERDNRMYRAMLNDAATEYKKLKHDRDLLMKTLKKVTYDARRLVEHIFGDES